MSDYTPTVDFAGKDSLATNNPAKIILGAEFDLEFNAIATAIATKTETVPVYPPFDTPDHEGNNRSRNVFVSNTNEISLVSRDFNFTRPDTSFFEYSLSINTNLHGAQNNFNTSNVTTNGSRVEYELRLTNLQTSATVDLSNRTVEVLSKIATPAGIQYTYRFSNPNGFTDFTTSTIETLIGASTSGYRAEVIARVPNYSATNGTIFLAGNFSVFIKELFQ